MREDKETAESQVCTAALPIDTGEQTESFALSILFF